MKNIFKKFSNAFSAFGQLEKKFLSLYDSAMQNKNTDNNDGVKGMKNIDSDDVATVYNVGKIKKRQSVGGNNKISARSSNKSAHDTSSINIITNSSKNVKKIFACIYLV